MPYLKDNHIQRKGAGLFMSATVKKLADLSNKPEAVVTAVLDEVRADALKRFGNKNSNYKDYVARVTYRRLGIKQSHPFKTK